MNPFLWIPVTVPATANHESAGSWIASATESCGMAPSCSTTASTKYSFSPTIVLKVTVVLRLPPVLAVAVSSTHFKPPRSVVSPAVSQSTPSGISTENSPSLTVRSAVATPPSCGSGLGIIFSSLIRDFSISRTVTSTSSIVPL